MTVREHGDQGDLILRTATGAAALLAIFVVSAAAAGDEDDVALRKYHPWGRFHVGSFNHVRVVTETLDDQGRVISTGVTDTRSTLTERGLESYSLKVENTVEVAGRKIPSQPQTVKLGYVGESLGEQLTFRAVDAQPLSIDGREIPCSAQEVEIVSDGQKRVTQVRYADKVAPFVLHRKTTQTDLASKSQTQETELEVIALDMPFRVCGELKSTAHTRQVQRGARGSTLSLSVVSPEVPGELVLQTSKKLDEKGRVTHRSTLELMGYLVAAAPPTEDPGDSRLPRRYHKKARHERR
jgi:hypothetical protein